MCKCKEITTSFLKGCLVLLAVLTYQLLCFLAFLSFSIGFSAVLSQVYEYFLSTPMPSACEGFASLYLLSIFAELHIYCQNECIGAALSSYFRTYPNLLSVGTNMIYTILYFLSFAEVYIQFHEVHVLHGEIHNSNRPLAPSKMSLRDPHVVQDDAGPAQVFTGMGSSAYDDKEQLHTALFLLSLSYIVYCTMKLIHADTLEQVRRITNQASCIHCVIALTFVFIHVLMDILYSIPLVIVAFSLRLYENGGTMCYIQLSLVGALSGLIFAVLETRRPWPTHRAMGPFFLYENNARAKTFCSQINIILILLLYYRPLNFRKIPESEFNAGNDYVLYFCFAVAFVMLHYVKMLVFISVQKDIIVQQRNGRIGRDDNEEDLVIVEVDPGNDNVHGQGENILLTPDNGDEFCKRCQQKDKEMVEEDNVNKNKRLKNEVSSIAIKKALDEMMLSPNVSELFRMTSGSYVKASEEDVPAGNEQNQRNVDIKVGGIEDEEDNECLIVKCSITKAEANLLRGAQEIDAKCLIATIRVTQLEEDGPEPPNKLNFSIDSETTIVNLMDGGQIEEAQNPLSHKTGDQMSEPVSLIVTHISEEEVQSGKQDNCCSEKIEMNSEDEIIINPTNNNNQDSNEDNQEPKIFETIHEL